MMTIIIKHANNNNITLLMGWAIITFCKIICKDIIAIANVRTFCKIMQGYNYNVPEHSSSNT